MASTRKRRRAVISTSSSKLSTRQPTQHAPLAKKIDGWGRFRQLATDAGIAITLPLIIGFIVASLASAGIISLQLAFIFLFLAWVAGFVLTFTSGTHWWPSNKHRLKFSIVLALILGCIGWYESAHYESPPTERGIIDGVVSGLSKQDSERQVFLAQFDELQKVADLFGGKDEYALRETFDYKGFVEFNLVRAKQVIAPNKVTPAKSAAMEQFFNGGAAIFDTRYVRMSPFNGSYKVDQLPGTVGILLTSKKYENAKRVLLPFETSPKMPISIQEAIKDFDRTLDNNTNLIIEVINQKTAENANYLLRADDPDSPYNGVIFNAYWNRFTPLKPKADVVLKQIRAFLKVR